MNTYPSETGPGENSSFDHRGRPSENTGTAHTKRIAEREHTAGSASFPETGNDISQAGGTLRGQKPGESFLITGVGGEGALRQHFLDMGLLPGSCVTVMQYAPMGDPMEIQIHGYELTIRLDDAANISVIPAASVPDTDSEQGRPENVSTAAAEGNRAGSSDSGKDRSGAGRLRADQAGGQPAAARRRGERPPLDLPVNHIKRKEPAALRQSIPDLENPADTISLGTEIPCPKTHC